MTDPRFDPRFQRGYSGPQPDPSSMPVPPFERRAEDSAVDPAGDPAEVAPGAVRDAATVAPDDLDAVWTPPRRNPFALALLIGGVAMIAIGAWLIWTLATAADYTVFDVGEQTVALLRQQLSPALLTCGVLAIVGWLVLGALAASATRRG